MLRLLAAVAFLLAGCRADTPDTRADVSIETEWQGQHGGATTPSTLVVRDASAWSDLWRQIGREPPQTFDPSRETAVAIFLGQRRSGGYQVEIVGVRRENDRAVLEYRERTPAPDAMVTQVISSPWAVAVLSGAPASVHPQQLPPSSEKK